MVFLKNVRYCEAELGERIDNFAKELVNYRKDNTCDVIGEFNGIYIKVNIQTTVQDIIDFYHQHI